MRLPNKKLNGLVEYPVHAECWSVKAAVTIEY